MELQVLKVPQRRFVANFFAELREGPGERFAAVLGFRLDLAEDADTLELLGEIDEVEVHGECSGNFIGAGDREGLGNFHGAIEGLGRFVRVRGDGCLPESFDIFEETR